MFFGLLSAGGALFSAEKNLGWSLEWHKGQPGARHLASHALLNLEASGAGGIILLDHTPAPKPAPQRVSLLRYISGTIGTTEPVLVVHGLVLAHEGPEDPPRPLADRPLAYLDPRDEHTPVGLQPRWAWSAEAVDILLPDGRDRERIALR